MSQGRTNLTLIKAIIGIVDTSHGRATEHIVTPSNYTEVVKLLQFLTDNTALEPLLDPRQTFAEAYRQLTESITTLIPQVRPATVDGVWLLLRPTFLAVRDSMLGAFPGNEFAPIISPSCDPALASQVIRPLEPFGRYLRQGARQNELESWVETYAVPGNRAAKSGDLPKGTATLIICKEGHVIERSRGKIVQSISSGGALCSICSGQTPLPGYNTLADTHPYLALQWDTPGNEGRGPETVIPGSNKRAAWMCPVGHRFVAIIVNRTRNGSGCPVCANFLLQPGVNDLATTHPGLAAEWHPELNNGLTPDQFIGGQKGRFAWLCPEGHTYYKPISKRKSGQGCPVCSGRTVMPGINDLATTHPKLAAQWDKELNGELTPEAVSAGSEKSVYWRCPRGHSYDAFPVNRTGYKKAGCPYCSKRKLLVGFNDLATQYPALAKDWNSARNGGLSAEDVLPGSRLWWWTCSYGHDQHMMFRNRLRAGGCTACPPDRRRSAETEPADPALTPR
ncbi:zinc-ribbon domain-containing protein [Arthrobacter sp. AK01]|uniref:zinc-ribbon domain-containing protein n=1 Tax=Arthrobacter sp. AK01 TaxID=2894084 RepID=UPI001E2C0872|nr:zinc-ribbon domain-containing protein [Arthrobacter sp. AK01]MCD4849695.1 zinc-ribbon domain-containing protein [Arthrobacter sp. AK01]